MRIRVSRLPGASLLRRRALALLLVLGLLLCGGSPALVPAAAQSGRLVVSFLDIGQGDSALVQTPSGANILIDTGPPSHEDALFDYLRLRGVRRLDLVITSHPHQDHYGNTREALRRIPTRAVMDSGLVTGSQTQERLLEEVRRQGIRFLNVSRQRLAGTTRNLGGGVTMRILQPRLPLIRGTESDPNNNSVVVRIALGNVSFLFTGDQQTEQRRRLLATNETLRSTFYKVAHHGSHNGTDDPFMDRVRPKEAVLSCSPTNSYGHPHNSTLRSLRRIEARVWRTDRQGTIKVDTDGRTYRVTALGK